MRWKSTLMEAIMQARKNFPTDGGSDQWKEEKFSQKNVMIQSWRRCEMWLGEIKGSEAAMQYALDHKIPSIINLSRLSGYRELVQW